MGGSVRLDGAELDQYGINLGRHIGYLPQEVILFDGTVAENIARLSPDVDDEEVVEAAKRTGAHEMILDLPDGYDFQVSAGGAALSGGQRQRIALARAFFGSPVVVVMDEPDSNLDAEGTMALARAVEAHKKRGGAAVIVAHRHGAFAQCDTVYLMEGGRPVPATSGRSSAPVRSLRGAEARISGGGPPAAEASRTDRQRSQPAGVPATADRPRAAARERDTGPAGAGHKRTGAAARPAVRIVRGGRKGAIAARAATPRPQRSERQGERSQAEPAGKTTSPDRDFARERRRRIADAIIRVSGARASARGDDGSGASESEGNVRGSDPRTNRDGAS